MPTDQSLRHKSPTYCLLVLSGLSVDAQTNVPVEPTHPGFSCPPLEIRTLESLEEEPEQKLSVIHEETPLQVTVDQAATVDPDAEWTVASSLDDIAPTGNGSPFQVEFHVGRNLVEFLEAPPVESDSLIDRVLVDPFTPVGIKVGKTTVCCSIITAIKRKNPLCLLNPIVLNISW